MLILRDTSELAIDVVSKNSIISKIFLKKVLELRPRYLVLGLKTMLILVPLLDHQPAEKQSGKKDLVRPNSPNNFEVILTLLTKTVAIQM